LVVRLARLAALMARQEPVLQLAVLELSEASACLSQDHHHLLVASVRQSLVLVCR
jgi:hypothetical protein